VSSRWANGEDRRDDLPVLVDVARHQARTIQSTQERRDVRRLNRGRRTITERGQDPALTLAAAACMPRARLSEDRPVVTQRRRLCAFDLSQPLKPRRRDLPERDWPLLAAAILKGRRREVVCIPLDQSGHRDHRALLVVVGRRYTPLARSPATTSVGRQPRRTDAAHALASFVAPLRLIERIALWPRADDERACRELVRGGHRKAMYMAFLSVATTGLPPALATTLATA